MVFSRPTMTSDASRDEKVAELANRVLALVPDSELSKRRSAAVWDMWAGSKSYQAPIPRPLPPVPDEAA